MRGDEPGSFLTVILGPPLPWDLQHGISAFSSGLSHKQTTYGDDGFLFSGEAFAAGSSCEAVDIREGEEFAGAPGGGAKLGQFFGLGLRVVVCGEDNGAAVAGATAVDMVEKRPWWNALRTDRVCLVCFICLWDRNRRIPPARSGTLTRVTSSWLGE